jgi:ornithine cyclodeaminase/alanine dehydrogenase-like protein (mu-crystallin family)
MMVFSAVTGQPLALLRDEGWLTSLRTALAGQISARVLAPLHVQAIGIVGTDVQARMQLLLPIRPENEPIVVAGIADRNAITAQFKNILRPYGRERSIVPVTYC